MNWRTFWIMLAIVGGVGTFIIAVTIAVMNENHIIRVICGIVSAALLIAYIALLSGWGYNWWVKGER